MPATTIPTCIPHTGESAAIDGRPGALRLVVVRTMEELLASRLQWNALAADHPFFNWEWISSWWHVYRGTGTAAILVAADDRGNWLGLFPMCIQRRPFWGKVLTHMGSGRACADHVRPILLPGCEDAVTRLFGNWIQAQAGARGFDLIEWDGVDQGDPLVMNLVTRLCADGMTVERQPIESSWIADLPGEWLPFEKSIKKCFRRKIQKAKRNRLLPGIEIRSLHLPDEIAAAWYDVERLHQSRHESQSQTGCFSEPGMDLFLRTALMRLAERGATELLMAGKDGRAFGMCAVLRFGDVAYLYQSGFDPEYRALEPGHLLLTCAVERAMGGGCRRFDFLRGDEPYKARWNAARLPLERIRLVPNQIGPRLRFAFRSGIRSLQNRLSRLRSTKPATASPTEED